MKNWINFALLSIILALMGCSKNSPTSPDSDLKGAGIIGTVFDKSGHKIKGAKIKVVSVSASLKKVASNFATSPDSTTTDGNGSFQIVLDPGTYDVQTDYGNGSLVSLNRNVSVQDSAPTELINVVKEPGKVHGSISLSVLQKRGLAKVNTDLSKGSCFIPRVSPVYRSDKDGICEIPIVPEGNHDVVFEFPDYLASTESLYVESGKIVNTNVNLEYDPSNVPPTPVLKEITYDTLHGIVKLVWNKVSVSDLKGYVIYRAEQVEASPTSYSTTQDTVFYDTVYKNPDPTQELPLDLLYLVKAQDSGLNVSAQYSNPLRMSVNPPDYYKTKISFIINPKNISIGDSVWIKAACSNRLRKNDLIFWEFDGKKIAHQMNGDLDSILYVSVTPKTTSIKVSVKDDFGYTWTAQTTLDVKLYPPVVHLAQNMNMYLDTVYQISANASDSVGSIVKYEWDTNGDGIFDTSTSTPKLKFSSRQSGKMIVRVQDDDGNKASDTTSYRVFKLLTGHISKDSTLSKIVTPYMVDLIVDSGATLNVDPGVEIALNGSGGGWGIQVYGNLNMIGTEADSIHVYDFNGRSGIVYYNSSKESVSTFSYVHTNMNGFGINTNETGKTIKATHCFFDDTHIVVGIKSIALDLMDAQNGNRFVKMNLQYSDGVFNN